jgi:hypothetical protein
MRFKISWRSRSLLAAAMLLGSSSVAHAGGALWWCYGGTCCEESGTAVTRNCDFNCDAPDGEQNAFTIVLACP